MTIKRQFKKVVVYVCVTFFLIAVAFVCITLRGKSQAGLIEVGCAAFLSVIFLQILKKLIPHASSMIVTILALLIACMLLFANFGMQRKKHSEYTFKEFLIGDFLVQRMMGIHKERPDALLARKLENIIPGEFAQTKTEKSTIESTYEKPGKDLMGEPVFLPIDDLNHVEMRKETYYALNTPTETVNHKLKFADMEGFKPGRPRLVTAVIEGDFDAMNEQVPGNYTLSPLYFSSKDTVSISLLSAVCSQAEREGESLSAEIQPVELEGYMEEVPWQQVMGELRFP
ncbi:MAG: hypothetical protein GY941_05955 [Planctomycetes bacterium]|nr:hypothetical protein [Planctomycetota bacterium]